MDDYDVVIDALQKHRDKLWEMSQRNMQSEYVNLNVMDDIRFYQIEQLDAAIDVRKNSKPCQTCEALARTVMTDNVYHEKVCPKREWQGLTDEDIAEMHYEIKVKGMGAYKTEDIYRAIEAKLKEKNSAT